MSLFKYRAVDPSGEPMEGTMEEESAQRVTSILQERGAQVNRVEKIGKTPSLGRGTSRLRWEDLAILNEQLLSITRGNIPIAPAVKAMAKDIDNRRLKPVLEQLQEDLEAGRSLEESLERSPKRFPSIYLSLVRAGEQSGNLAGVLEMLRSHSTRLLDLRDRIFISLTYPVIVVIVAIMFLVFLFLKIVPVFAEIFTEFGSSLPAPTQFLVDLSDALRYWTAGKVVFWAIVVVLACFAVWHMRGSSSGRARADRLRQTVPIFGRTFRMVTLARFSRALGMLLRANVPILESLDLASAASGNEYLRANVQKASVHISQGEKIADAFSDTHYFPHSYLWFLANGEARGQVPETLLELSETYEQEVSTRDESMIHMIAPFAILGLGFIIGFIVVALYLPIFTLGDAISQ